ncbi:MAG: SBBP repeat-containing protein [Dehalococcoidia bacterium]
MANKYKLVFTVILFMAITMSVMSCNGCKHCTSGEAHSDMEGPVVEEWVNQYHCRDDNRTFVWALTHDSKGNVYITGGTTCSDERSSDYFTIKYDETGSKLWDAAYNHSANKYDSAYDIAVDEEGYVYVTGFATNRPKSGTEDGSNQDYATIKYNRDGEEIWVSIYDSGGELDKATELALDEEGNVYVAGTIGVSKRFDRDTAYATVKYNSEGEQLWVARYSGEMEKLEHKVNELVVDDAGNVYVTGSRGTVKYDEDGNEKWVDSRDGESMAVDDSGSVYFTGSHGTIKLDSAGNTVWMAPHIGSDIALDQSGNVYITGTSGTVKYDDSGNSLWIVNDGGSRIVLDSAGFAYVTHVERPEYAEDQDFTVAKYDHQGEKIWLAQYDGRRGDTDEVVDIAVDLKGDVYITGYSEFRKCSYLTHETRYSEIVTIKYSQGS